MKKLHAFMLLLAGGCVAPLPQPELAAVTVNLIAFNDFHGHLQPPGTPTRLPAVQGEPQQTLPTGGVVWLAGQIAKLKREHAHPVVVASGDLFGGSPLISALLDHEPTVQALGQAGLEFAAVGNHEFDRGVKELLRLQGLARFQYLGANVRYREGGKPLLPAWKLKTIDIKGGHPVRIAFIGAVLRSTPSLVTGEGVKDVEFLDEADAVNAAVREIRAQGVEAIVLLIHEGGFTSQSRFDDATCPGFRGPILQIMERLDPAVDVVVSGHTHITYICRHAGRLVTSAGQEGRFLTDIELTIDPASGDIQAARARQVPVINDTAPNPLAAEFPVSPADAGLKAQVATWAESIGVLAKRQVGTVSTPLTRRQNESGETTLGNAIADGQLAATAAPDAGGAQIAIANNGGLRADLAAPDGKVSYEQAFAVHPFGNHLVTLTLTGSEIDTLLETQWQGAGSLLQVSKGFSFQWSASAPPGARVPPGGILLNGTPLEPQGLYRVTVSDFLAGGGDGYAVLRNGRDPVTGLLDVEALEKYLAQHTPLAPPVSGRITKLP